MDYTYKSKLQILSYLPTNSSFRASTNNSSMIPYIRPGDLISIKKIPFEKVRVNDVIAFSISEHPYLIAHRVVSVSWAGGKKRFYTKGDNNSVKDKWMVDKSNYIGLVKMGKLSFFRKINYFLGNLIDLILRF